METTKLICIGAVCAAVAIAALQADTDKSVSAAQINGTWKTEGGEFKSLAIGN